MYKNRNVVASPYEIMCICDYSVVILFFIMGRIDEFNIFLSFDSAQFLEEGRN